MTVWYSRISAAWLIIIKRLTVQLVSNYFVAEDVKPSAIEQMHRRIEGVPEGVELDVRIETTFVICRIIEMERKSPLGRRYGHPIIDIAREINRYMHPQIAYGEGR